MLQFPEYHEEPLKDSLREVFRMVDTKDSIPKYILKAQKLLRLEANRIRGDNGEELLPEIDWNEINE